MLGLFFQSRKHLIATQNYFEKKGLVILGIRNPKSSEWEYNPFKNSNKYWYSPLRPFDWSLLDYKIIEVSNPENTNVAIYWRQVKSQVMSVNTIQFRKSEILSKIENERYRQNLKKVTNKCPACGSLISPNDETCPDCEISFI